MTFLGWAGAFSGAHLPEQDILQGLKEELLKSLYDGGPDCDYLKARITSCRNRGQLVLARADVMQFLSRRLGEEVAIARLKGLWERDPQMRQFQGAVPGRHGLADRP